MGDHDLITGICGPDARAGRTARGLWAITQAVDVHPAAAREVGVGEYVLVRVPALLRCEWEALGETWLGTPAREPGEGLLRFVVFLYPLAGGAIDLYHLSRVTDVADDVTDDVALARLAHIHRGLFDALRTGTDLTAAADGWTGNAPRIVPPSP